MTLREQENPTVAARLRGTGSAMLTGPRDVPSYDREQHVVDCMRHAVEIILSWPCPACSRPYPCPCDAAPLGELDLALLDR